MATTVAELVARLRADTSDFKRGMSEADRALQKSAQGMAKFGQGMQTVGKALTVGVTIPFTLAAVAGLRELEESSRQAAITEAHIKSTGAAANVTAKQIDEMSAALSRKTGIDDEVIAGGQNMLLTFTNVRNEVGKGNHIFDRATKAALDLSFQFGSVDSGAKMLGKALQDPVKGLTALGRAGVQFSEQQKTAIKRMVETGDILGAQKIILQEVERQVGGTADAYGKTLGGQINKAKNALMESAASMVSVAAPALQVIASGAKAAAKWIQGLPGPIKAVIAAFATFAAIVGPVMLVIGKISTGFASLQKNSPKLAGAVSTVGSALGKLTAAAFVVGGILALKDAFSSTQKNVEKATESIQRMQRVADGQLLPTFRGLSRAAEMGMFGDKMQSDADVFRQLAETNIGTARRLRDQIAETGSETAKYDKILRQEAEAQRQAKSDTEAATQAVKSNAEALREVHAAATEIINAQLGLSGALLNVESAARTAAEATRDHGAASFEARSAQQALAENILAAGQAAYDQAFATSTAKNAADRHRDATAKQIDALNFLKGTLDPGSPLRKRIDEYIFKLASIPRDVKTTVTLDATSAFGTIGRIRSELASLEGGSRQARENLENRQFGGPVQAGRAYVVGEKRPELFVPHASGRIVPQVPHGGGGMGVGGNTFHLHFHIAGSVLSERQLIQVVREGLRRGVRQGFGSID